MNYSNVNWPKIVESVETIVKLSYERTKSGQRHWDGKEACRRSLVASLKLDYGTYMDYVNGKANPWTKKDETGKNISPQAAKARKVIEKPYADRGFEAMMAELESKIDARVEQKVQAILANTPK
jgi:hypothetical protein